MIGKHVHRPYVEIGTFAVCHSCGRRIRYIVPDVNRRGYWRVVR